jgi:hypothetical protein
MRLLFAEARDTATSYGSLRRRGPVARATAFTGQFIGSDYGLTSQIFVLVHFPKIPSRRDGYLANSLFSHVRCETSLTSLNGLRLRSDENCQSAAPPGGQQLPGRAQHDSPDA